ncbi:hypothetical protein RRG08_015663 [Elysia crispata]|uniref:Uncharacterized protein n=1 Tax=Elysia crispata TaxID=231223 RepID=A0AAE1CR64_9GAST|nr:hypothetical protein RRG08_015663 [Elysia crispata]
MSLYHCILYSFDVARRISRLSGERSIMRGMTMWLIIVWCPDNWNKVRENRFMCTQEQLEEVLEGHFTTEALILHQEPSVTEVGMVSRVEEVVFWKK